MGLQSDEQVDDYLKNMAEQSPFPPSGENVATNEVVNMKLDWYNNIRPTSQEVK